MAAKLWGRIQDGREPVLVAAAVELVVLLAATFGWRLDAGQVVAFLALIGVQTAGVRANVKPDKWSTTAKVPQK